jgi:hypothetical protein
MIAVLGTGHDDANGKVSLVVHDVRHESRLASPALAYEHAHLVVANLARVKLFELQIGHFLTMYWIFYTRETRAECFLGVK